MNIFQNFTRKLKDILILGALLFLPTSHWIIPRNYNIYNRCEVSCNLNPYEVKSVTPKGAPMYAVHFKIANLFALTGGLISFQTIHERFCS